MIRFASEAALVETAIDSAKFRYGLGHSDWGCWYQKEFACKFGRPDLFVAFGRLDGQGRQMVRTFAFEMKLQDWKKGLWQAYRYRAYSNFSALVIDHWRAGGAVKNIAAFRRSNIGLILFRPDGNVKWIFKPRIARPYFTPYAASVRSRCNSNLFSENCGTSVEALELSRDRPLRDATIVSR